EMVGRFIKQEHVRTPYKDLSQEYAQLEATRKIGQWLFDHIRRQPEADQDFSRTSFQGVTIIVRDDFRKFADPVGIRVLYFSQRVECTKSLRDLLVASHRDVQNSLIIARKLVLSEHTQAQLPTKGDLTVVGAFVTH